MQLWCNWGGKDRFCALDGLFLVHSIERMEWDFLHGKDAHNLRPIRNQTLYPLSYGCMVGRLYLFRGEKSRNASAADLLGSILGFSGAIKARNGRIAWIICQYI